MYVEVLQVYDVAYGSDEHQNADWDQPGGSQQIPMMSNETALIAGQM
jgi:hypothetical protein